MEDMEDLEKLSSDQVRLVKTFFTNIEDTGMVCKDDICNLESKIGINLITEDTHINKFTDKLSTISVEVISKKMIAVNELLNKTNTLPNVHTLISKVMEVVDYFNGIKNYLIDLYENVPSDIYITLQNNLKNDDNFLEWKQQELLSVLTNPVADMFNYDCTISERVFSFTFDNVMKSGNDVEYKPYDVLPIIIDDVPNNPEMFTNRVGTIGDMRNLLSDIPKYLAIIKTIIEKADSTIVALEFLHRKDVKYSMNLLEEEYGKYGILLSLIENDVTRDFIKNVVENLKRKAP